MPSREYSSNPMSNESPVQGAMRLLDDIFRRDLVIERHFSKMPIIFATEIQKYRQMVDNGLLALQQYLVELDTASVADSSTNAPKLESSELLIAKLQDLLLKERELQDGGAVEMQKLPSIMDVVDEYGRQLRAYIDGIQMAQAVDTTRVRELEEQLNAMQEELTKKQAQVSELQHQRDQSASEKAALRQEVANARADAASVREERQKLERQLLVPTRTIESLQASLQKAEKTDVELSHARVRLKRLEDEWRTEQWRLEHQYQTLRGHLVRSRATSAARKSECQSLSQQLDKVQSAIAAFETNNLQSPKLVASGEADTTTVYELAGEMMTGYQQPMAGIQEGCEPRQGWNRLVDQQGRRQAQTGASRSENADSDESSVDELEPPPKRARRSKKQLVFTTDLEGHVDSDGEDEPYHVDPAAEESLDGECDEDELVVKRTRRSQSRVEDGLKVNLDTRDTNYGTSMSEGLEKDASSVGAMEQVGDTFYSGPPSEGDKDVPVALRTRQHQQQVKGADKLKCGKNSDESFGPEEESEDEDEDSLCTESLVGDGEDESVTQWTRHTKRQAEETANKSKNDDCYSDEEEASDVKEPVAKRTLRSRQQAKCAADDSEDEEDDYEEEEFEESSRVDKVDDEQTTIQTRSSMAVPFAERLESLKIFKKRNGHLFVPLKFEGLDRLGSYVKVTRARYNGCKGRSPLPPDKIDALNEIGFEWNGKGRYFTFDERLVELKKYKAKHNHLFVPYRDKGLHKLGAYVHKLRRLYKGASRHGPQLTTEEIAKLEAIGFVWDASKRKRHENDGS